MPKRVGITTDPAGRKKVLEDQYIGLKNWQIVGRNLTYNQAQEKENRYRNRGYEGHAGGAKKSGKCYFVYTFDYKRKK